MVHPLHFDFRIGAVAGADHHILRNFDRRLDLELVGAIGRSGFRRDVLQESIEFHILQGSDPDDDRHSFDQAAHLRFVHVAVENQVVHVRDRCDGRTVIEGVAEGHGVADLDRNVEDQTGNRRADQGGAGRSVAPRHTVPDYLQGLLGGGILLLRLGQGLGIFLEFFRTDQLLVIQVFLTVVVGVGLVQGQLGQPDPALGGAQRTHLGNDLDLGDDLAFRHLLASLLVELGDDTADLRLDIDLVARDDLAGHHGRAGNVADHSLQGFIPDLHRTGFPPEIGEGTQDHQGNQSKDQILLKILHIALLFLLFNYFLQERVNLHAWRRPV